MNKSSNQVIKVQAHKNILWLDIAKFVGIFLVIFSHSLDLVNPDYKSLIFYIQGFIDLFHMPLFFILAGYLYKNKGLKNNYSKILWSLLIPYFIYQFAFLPFSMSECIFYHHFSIFNSLKRLLVGIVLGDVANKNNLFITNCAPCWFLVVMIQLRTLFAHIKLSLKNSLITAGISLFITYILLFYKINLLFCLDITLYAVPFFIFGYLLNLYHNKITKISDIVCIKYLKPIIIIFCFLLMLLILRLNGYLHLARFTTSFVEHQSLLLCYLAGILGSVSVILFSSYIKNNTSFIETIAKNTLFILYFHWQIRLIMIWVGTRSILLKYLYVYNPISIFSHHLILFQSIFLCIALSTLNLIINYYAIKLAEKNFSIILGKYRPKK